MHDLRVALLGLSSLALVACGKVVGLGEERVLPPQIDAGDDGRVVCEGRVRWVRQFGDEGGQIARDIVSDRAGGIYLTGFFAGAIDFGGQRMVSAGEDDIFLARLDGEGRLTWSRRFGSPSDQFGSITLTALPDGVLLSGEYTGAVDFGDGERTASGFSDGFIAKFDLDGQHLWTQTLSGPSFAHSELVTNVESDSSGALYFSAVFVETISFGGKTFTSQGMKDMLLAKLAPDGTPIWTRQFGAIGDDAPNWVSVGADTLFMGASSQGTFSMGQEELPVSIGWDALLGAYTPQSDALFTRRFQGTGDSGVQRMTVDSTTNELWMTGRLRFGGSIDLGGDQLFANEGAFLARLGPDGSHRASRALENFYAPTRLVVDAQGNVLIAGSFQDVLQPGGEPVVSHGGQDGVVIALGPGLEHLWTVQIGSIATDDGYGVSVDVGGNVFALANFQDTLELDGCPALESAGSSDLVLLKLAP